ncbi:hypothetical protein NMG60_11024866 [Bertholletia excelsa]
MDSGGLNMRNWGYYEPSLKGQLGLQLMSSVAERDTKPFLHGCDHTVMVSGNGAFHPQDCVVSEASVHTNRDTKPLLHARDNLVMVSGAGAFHHRDCLVSEAPVHMDYVRESWVSQREKFLNTKPVNPNFSFLPEPFASHPMQILQPPDTAKDVRMGVEDAGARKHGCSLVKRAGDSAVKTPNPKKSKKSPSLPKDNGKRSVQLVKPAKKIMDVVINGIDMDISGIPIPVCSCTGTPQQCYRWGCGGWQSACCTTTISTYPLPMSTKRRGARIAGRKMSQGAFKKVLEKLAAECYNFSIPIDLRNFWAKHGTNKFVTIRIFIHHSCEELFRENINLDEE